MSNDALSVDGASCHIYRDAPSWDGLQTAAIGRFRCSEASAGAALLELAASKLAGERFGAIIGPMDGDTWHSYRVVTETDGSPPFLMEPTSGEHDKPAFEAAGFAPISRYVSTRTSLASIAGDAAAAGPDDVAISVWDGKDAHKFLSAMFDLSGASFDRNAFFKPIDRADFLALYEPMLPRLDPRLVFFAHDKDGLAGFLFGMPNLLEGAGAKAAILKTYASRKRGVGHQLANAFHRTARELGFADVIHALMHESNISLERSSRHHTRIFRRYALMGRRLA